VFARSADGKFYAAQILNSQGHSIQLKFLNGGEHRLPLEDIRPLAIMPGQRLVCPWPNWGWWTCAVLSYDAENRRVRVTDNWGSEETFSLADVHMNPPREKSSGGGGIRAKLAWMMLSCAGIGIAIGGLVTWLFMR
jgi:hypothetical protein